MVVRRGSTVFLLVVDIYCFCFQAFDDKRTLSNILLQLAMMALAESNWGQATSLLLEAQVRGIFGIQSSLVLFQSADGKWYSFRMTSGLRFMSDTLRRNRLVRRRIALWSQLFKGWITLSTG